MSHHPFLNPASSRGYVAAEHQHLLWKNICFAGGIGTLLAVLTTGLLWYCMEIIFKVSSEMVVGSHIVSLTLQRSLLLSGSGGVVLSSYMMALNALVQQPFKVFRYTVLCAYLLSCCVVLVLPCTSLQKLWLLLISTGNVGVLTTVLTRYVV